MAKQQSMGKEYKITFEGDWPDVAEAVRTTKQLIEDSQRTQSRGGGLAGGLGFGGLTDLFDADEAAIEDRTLQAYLVPGDAESFAEYQGRFLQAFTKPGWRGGLARWSIGKKVPFSFKLIRNDGESTFRVGSTAKEGSFDLTIQASGDYSSRGEAVAQGLREHLADAGMQPTYQAVEQII